MKFLDDVKVINDNYKNEGITKGMIGTIIDAEIRFNCFNVVFIDRRVKDKNFMSIEDNIYLLNEDIVYPIKITDLELVKDNGCLDNTILDSIPQHKKDWWCKVENGYITNLLGQKKNKIPYDYDS